MNREKATELDRNDIRFHIQQETKQKTKDSIVTEDQNEIPILTAKYPLGAQGNHRLFPFRGIVFDVDPNFSNSEEWYQSIPENLRPRKDQPFYHLLAENDEEHRYFAYVSEQNLLPDTSDTPVKHDAIAKFFSGSVKSGLKTRQRKH